MAALRGVTGVGGRSADEPQPFQTPPNTWLQPTAVDLVASLPATRVPSLRSAAAEPKR
jgi:hypothetical protein